LLLKRTLAARYQGRGEAEGTIVIVAEQSIVQKLAAGPIQFMLDRGVRESESARGLCKRLEGRTLQVRTGIPAFDAYLRVDNNRLEWVAGDAGDADAVLEGTPLQLAKMVGSDPQSVIREGDVKISGSTEVADDFQALLDMVRPDLEEELSHFTGDVIAHEMGEGARALGQWLTRAERTLSRSMGEYLSEEARAVVTAAELEQFCAAVDVLASDVDRLEARLKLLQAANTSSEGDP
jgi:ubiquinone biosynthesis protein UbiJ